MSVLEQKIEKLTDVNRLLLETIDALAVRCCNKSEYLQLEWLMGRVENALDELEAIEEKPNTVDDLLAGATERSERTDTGVAGKHDMVKGC